MTSLLPFECEAKALGYEIHSFGANRRSATYVKERTVLHVRFDPQGRMVGKLFFLWRLLTVSTGEFSLPHPRLLVFEKQIIYAQVALQEVDMIEGG